MDNKEAIKEINKNRELFHSLVFFTKALDHAIETMMNVDQLLQLCNQVEEEKGVHHIHINDVRTTLINDCTTCKYGLENIDFEKCVKCMKSQDYYTEWESENDKTN